MIKTYAEKETTKKWIYDSLVFLVDSIPYDKITITSICKKAGVPRSTFYRYYCNKEDILRDHIQYFFEAMSYYLKKENCTTIEDFIYYHLYFFNKNKIFFKTLVKIHKEHIFFDYIANENFYFNFEGDNKNMAIYQAIALLSIIFHWVTSENSHSERYMVKVVMSFVSKDILEIIFPIFLKAHTKL